MEKAVTSDGLTLDRGFWVSLPGQFLSTNVHLCHENGQTLERIMGEILECSVASSCLAYCFKVHILKQTNNNNIVYLDR